HGGFSLLARGPRLNRCRSCPDMVGQTLLRPHPYIGDLRVHDGSLRSTSTHGAGVSPGWPRQLTVQDRFSTHEGAWTLHSHSTNRIRPARRQELFSWRRISPYIVICKLEANRLSGLSKRKCLMRFTTIASWTWRVISPAWAVYLLPTPLPPPIQNYAVPLSPWTSR